MVSISIPLKPKALSPSMATTGLPVVTAAPMAYPIPMPITPQVPVSSRFRGSYISMMLRAKSSVFVPDCAKCARKVHRVGVGIEPCRHAFDVVLLAISNRFGPRRLDLNLSRLEHGQKRGHSRSDVRDNGCGDRAVAVNFRRRNVNLHETCVGRPLRWFAMTQKPVQPSPDQHDDIGLAKNERAGRGRTLRMVIGQESLGHRHRQIGDTRRLNE